MPRPPAEALIGLGSNLGDRLRFLRTAVARLASLGSVAAVSPLYETAPVGGPEQGPYLNAVAALETVLAPREVLDGLLRIEAGAGRRRRVRWAARTLDLDLLTYGDAEIDEPGLTVPHPGITARRFVLEPVLAVRSNTVLPSGEPLARFLAEVADQDLATVAGPGWPRGFSSPAGTDGAGISRLSPQQGGVAARPGRNGN